MEDLIFLCYERWNATSLCMNGLLPVFGNEVENTWYFAFSGILPSLYLGLVGDAFVD